MTSKTLICHMENRTSTTLENYRKMDYITSENKADNKPDNIRTDYDPDYGLDYDLLQRDRQDYELTRMSRLRRGLSNADSEPEYLDEFPGHSFDENVATWAALDPSTDY